MIIHLEHSLPDVSRALPEYKHENLLRQMANILLFRLAPGGVYLCHIRYRIRGVLLPHLFTLTYKIGGYFLWHFP